MSDSPYNWSAGGHMRRAATSQRRATKVKPKLFVGSSVEGLRVAEVFKERLKDDADLVLWSDPGVFGASEFTLESLERALDEFTGAVIVLSPDDIVHTRGRDEVKARDNVIFELGMFIGRHSRRSVFFAVPEAGDLKVPSDIMGFTPVTYLASGFDGIARYDVTKACAEIRRALHSQPQSVQRTPSPFWDVLSDTIIILFGVEPDITGGAHTRYRLSLRDLETAWELKTFLERRYPAKRVWPIPTTAIGWERLMQTARADLIVVGGFVTNTEFAKQRSEFENFFRLRMGRLCIVDGQRVHIPEFAVPPGVVVPDVHDGQSVENFPSDNITRDFGFVFNGSLHVYGCDRRVVAIAGVKGHGTRAAAMFVSDLNRGIDSYLENRTLGANDTVEIAVAADVASDVVHKIDAVSIVLNRDSILPAQLEHSTPCELKRPCEGCEFGVRPSRSHRHVGTNRISSRVRAIVFDLDDTLVDTFSTLIVPLESKAAKEMVQTCMNAVDPTHLASALLNLRRRNPSNLEQELRKAFPDVNRKALSVRNKVLKDIPIQNLTISPEVTQMLRHLRNRFDLYLLTAGKLQYQNHKINRLEIRKLFMDTIVVTDTSMVGKARAIESLLRDRQLSVEEVLIIGNRLDNEIAAANSLNIASVWIRHGEGSDLTPGAGTAMPDATVYHIREVASLLHV